MEKFVGSWKFTTHDPDPNALDNYMKQWGVSWTYRQVFHRVAAPIIRFKESSKQPGKYVFISKSKGMVSRRYEVGPFQLGGESTTELRGDGSKFQSTFSMTEDGKLVHVAVDDNGNPKKAIPTSTSTREIDSEGRLKVTAECNGAVVVRLYEKAEDEDEEVDGAL